jgi:phage/plasmid-like protein (TIGR03299 family)
MSDGMFVARQRMLHSMGLVLGDNPTRKEVQAQAHPWEPVGVPLFRETSSILEDGTLYEGFERIPGYRANIRDDSGATIGVVQDSYTNVLNNELYDVAEQIEKSGADVEYETAGTLNGGSKVWVMIRLQEPLEVIGDPNGATVPYYALQNSHDGSGAFRGQATMTRIICANTARIADIESKARGTSFDFRHSKNVGQKIEQAREALAGWRQSLEDWKIAVEGLIAMPVAPLMSQIFLEKFITMPSPSLLTERSAANVVKERSKWLEFYNSATGEGLKKNAYGLVQASIEYSNWGRRANNNESLFSRTFLDKSKIIATAVDLAKEASLESNGLTLENAI